MKRENSGKRDKEQCSVCGNRGKRSCHIPQPYSHPFSFINVRRHITLLYYYLFLFFILTLLSFDHSYPFPSPSAPFSTFHLSHHPHPILIPALFPFPFSLSPFPFPLSTLLDTSSSPPTCPLSHPFFFPITFYHFLFPIFNTTPIQSSFSLQYSLYNTPFLTRFPFLLKSFLILTLLNQIEIKHE